jgi:hypothetical protein
MASARSCARARRTRELPGFEYLPVYPHNILYAVHITASAPELAEPYAVAQRVGPIGNLLAHPQTSARRLPERTAAAV